VCPLPCVSSNNTKPPAGTCQNDVGAAVLSVSSPALGFVDGDAARELARSADENARALITAHPDRFGAFGLLPLPDVDASLREIAHALDTLGLDGVGVLRRFSVYASGNSRSVIASLESFEGLSSNDQQAIASGNVRRLLPKVGAR
jgi:predicted TIM-barrel fold metal-dependent hydrolase